MEKSKSHQNRALTLNKLAVAISIICSALSVAKTADAALCNKVEREMTYGQTALEIAKNKAGFLRAAKEFEKAARKAPGCAAAHFNAGVVLEKAEQFRRAKEAFERYLKLSPRSPDAKAVAKRLYRLEYLIENASSDATMKPDASADTVRALIGQWVLDDGFQRSAYRITPNRNGGVLMEFDRCLTQCRNFTPNPVNRYRLRVTGDSQLSGTHETKWARGPASKCQGRQYEAPVDAYVASDSRSIVLKIQKHRQYNNFYCRYETNNGYSLTLTR